MWVYCMDGFHMSVIDKEEMPLAYCDDTSVEIGFPSCEEPLIMPWAESPETPTDTVYGYVPVDVVTNVIVKHGGIVQGQVPPGVIAVPAE